RIARPDPGRRQPGVDPAGPLVKFLVGAGGPPGGHPRPPGALERHGQPVAVALGPGGDQFRDGFELAVRLHRATIATGRRGETVPPLIRSGRAMNVKSVTPSSARRSRFICSMM